MEHLVLSVLGIGHNDSLCTFNHFCSGLGVDRECGTYLIIIKVIGHNLVYLVLKGVTPLRELGLLGLVDGVLMSYAYSLGLEFKGAGAAQETDVVQVIVRIGSHKTQPHLLAERVTLSSQRCIVNGFPLSGSKDCRIGILVLIGRIVAEEQLEMTVGILVI